MQSSILAQTDHFPIVREGKVYSGKVRSVYWLTQKDSQRLIEQNSYPIDPDAELGIMIISDRISAFECNWSGGPGLEGIPGKGAALNAISLHWFNMLAEQGLAGNHIVATPHPLVWLIQKAKPLRFEAIGRQYIAGSMWRSYAKGNDVFAGVTLPAGLQKHQKLDELLITPSTKGTLYGLPGIPEEEDTPITAEDIRSNYEVFGLKEPDELSRVEYLLTQGFKLISDEYAKMGQILVDTKFEFGTVLDAHKNRKIIFIDEVATPDSSRIWAMDAYCQGKTVELCKENFRRFLLGTLDNDILLDPKRMDDRKALAASYQVPLEEIMEISGRYKSLVKTVTGKDLPEIKAPESEVMDVLSDFGLLESKS